MAIRKMRVKMDLFDMKSVEKAVNHAMEVSNNIDKTMKAVNTELALKAENRLRSELERYGLEGSRLSSHVKVMPKWDGVVISATSKYAMYVEFGTGIIGENSMHPNTNFQGANWSYDVNNHGSQGWWYPTNENDPNPTKRYDESKSEWFAWTAGSEAKPFMYNTYRYIRRITTRTINKHIDKLVSKI